MYASDTEQNMFCDPFQSEVYHPERMRAEDLKMHDDPVCKPCMLPHGSRRESCYVRLFN